MNLLPEAMPGLRALLLRPDEIRAAIEQHDLLIAPAEAALARLRTRLADLNREATEVANQHLPADQQRIAQLIAGAEVQQLDKMAIEARAVKESILAAHRRQVSLDATALRQHLDDLVNKRNALRLALAEAEAAFVSALADAVLDAYKWNAIEFVRTNIPALYSVASAMRARTGKSPCWANRVFPGPAITWGEDETMPDPLRPGTGAVVHLRTTVWPRKDNQLLSGEPIHSDDLVDTLISAIRDSCDPNQEAQDT